MKKVLVKQQNSENKKKRKSNSQIGKKNMTKSVFLKKNKKNIF